ncbi:hypothetical protein HMPREF1624_05510 [Sporothrix schenckii ATCC 58251]|uniref:Ubiquitin interaction domain-containing protein n=1 Tax=Sporothrix schenckii (strain ATCC 58251 / de Perez 2211183) TaxID=1391915 RepID=U7PSV3_SPOS1|nr:hypothetical protein HMPREF1624_05510 [Sporothrix schenckii ATCC 58251]
MEDPPESAIAEVCEFANLDPVGDRNLVIAALKAKSGSVQDVVLSFYDDPSKFRQTYTWDETSFTGDRDSFNNTPLPSFNIQGPDDNASSIIHGISPAQFHSVPPSRPPSRVQSPLSRMTDWTASDVGAPTSKLQADEDLERALAESAAMAGTTHAPQETGITMSHDAAVSTELPFFGPANRDVYDPDQWAMVRASPEVLEPPPSGRKREPGVPVFLRNRRSGTEASALGALLTILHAIPAARNALLRSGRQPATYGQNSEWWKGSRIQPLGVPDNDGSIRMATPAAATAGMTTVISVDSDEDDTSSSSMADGGRLESGPRMNSAVAREYVEEMHRLMAFLDSTDRAYGTADNLADTAVMRECYGMEMSQRFFEAARRLDLPEILHTFFCDVQLMGIKHLGVPLRSESYAILEIKVDGDNVPFGLHDLYSAIDAIYWEDLYRFDPNVSHISVHEASMAVLAKVAPVQILRLSTNRQVPFIEPFDVPEVLYTDRYMGENASRALEIQVHLQKVYDTIRKIDAAMRDVTAFNDHSSAPHTVVRDRVVLSDQAIAFAIQKEWQYRAEMVWGRYKAAQNTPESFDYNEAQIYAAEPVTDEEKETLRTLQTEIAVHRQKLISIQKRVQKLQFEREALVELSRRLRRKYTVPSENQNWSPTSKYSLRGVIVSPDKFYFCRREAQPKPEQEPERQSHPLDEEASERGDHAKVEAEVKGKGTETEQNPEPALSTSSTTMATGDQWWMVSYNGRDASPITIQKTTVDVARGSVFLETDTPILVYSNAASLAEENVALPDALRTFIRFDNRFFKQEMLEESPRDKKRQPVEEPSPTSPLKRQQRANSIDSMASNMASLGEYSDRDMEDVPLLNDDRFTTDMDEGVFARGVGSGYDVHEWTLNRTMDEAMTKRAGADGMDFAEPVLPQREVDTLPGYDEAVADSAPIPAATDTKQEHKGSLGTEMVQRAIHGGDKNFINGTNLVDTPNVAPGADASLETPRATASVPDLIDFGQSQMQERSQSPGQMLPPPPPQIKKPQQAHQNDGAIQLLADWDNPEGRYVGHAEDAADGA